MNKLFHAIRIATRYHEGQIRKYTNPKVPYISHCLRVMAKAIGNVPHMSNDYYREAIGIGAVLHDTLEDTALEQSQIRNLFGQPELDIVIGLTNTAKVTHPNANRAERKRVDRERLSIQPNIVKTIKMIDRIDNLREIPYWNNKEAFEFAKVYLPESTLLLGVLWDADKALSIELRDLIEFMTKDIERFKYD